MSGTGYGNRVERGFASLEALGLGSCPACLGYRGPRNHSHGQCPDCALERRLDGMGQRLHRSKRYVGSSTGKGDSSTKCQTCLDTGAIPLYGKDRLDPYMEDPTGWLAGWLARG